MLFGNAPYLIYYFELVLSRGYVMNSDFSRIVTLLRKERGLSQKQAALELGVSQALLSHYEKGIRECGLDFVVRIADYYDVSCDYLLGRSADRQGATLRLDELSQPEPEEISETKKSNAMITLNKKLILSSINILFGLLEEADCKGLTNEVSSYVMVSVYKMLRSVYSANAKNPQAMFSVLPELYSGLSSALQSLLEANTRCIAAGKNADGFDGLDSSSALSLSPDIISRKYPELAPALFNLIRDTEEKIKKLI